MSYLEPFTMNKLLEIIRIIRDQIPSMYYPAQSRVVTLLDPGHGGVVDGVYTTAPSKMFVHPTFTFYEGVFNRAIAWTLAFELYKKSLGYYILVPEDLDISLRERVRRAEILKPELKNINKSCYYHAIHGNADKTGKARGIEIYTSPGTTPADPIATIFYYKLSNVGWKMRPGIGDGDPDKEEKFYVLTQTSMPAFLSENGFYTNIKDAEMMRNQWYINKLVDQMVDAHQTIIKLHLI